jgi:elongation factor 1 alpha-like protein
MSRKGGWYDETDDYYDDDDDDDDWDDGFGDYDTGSLAKKKPAASGGGKGSVPSAGGAKPSGGGGGKGAQSSARPKTSFPAKPPTSVGVSAMAKTMSATPKEKGVSPRAMSASERYPATPPVAPDASSSSRVFGFDAPSPDDAVLSRRERRVGDGDIEGGARVKAASGVAAVTAAVAKARITEADAETIPVSSDYASYVPSPDELELVQRAERHVHLVVLGHVDAGKSTLFGRTLYALGHVSDARRRRNEKDAAALGKASFSWAFALDERPEERARGVTVDVAKATFDTGKTRVTLLDAPGHKDFISNAIAGAAQADAACLVLDASRGGFETGFTAERSDSDSDSSRRALPSGQTQEHARLAKSLGVEFMIVAVSKMDACSYDADRFAKIRDAFAPFLRLCGFAEDKVLFVPVSGAEGVNLVADSATGHDSRREDGLGLGTDTSRLRSWYPRTSHSLISAIDAIPTIERGKPMPFRFPVAGVADAEGLKGFSGARVVGGKVEAGSIRVGDVVLVQPAGVSAVVRAVLVSRFSSASPSRGSGGGASANETRAARDIAVVGDACDVVLDAKDGGDLSSPSSCGPGSVLCHVDFPLRPARRIVLKAVTLDAARVPLLVGTPLVVHAYAGATDGRVSRLISTADKKTGEIEKRNPRCVAKNTACVLEITPSRPVCVELFRDYKALGRVQLRKDGATVALGVVLEIFS